MSQLQTRLTGSLFLAAIGIGVFAEFGAHGTMRTVLRIAALVCYLLVTFLFYRLFRRVKAGLSLTAAILSASLVVFAPLRWHPAGVDVGLVCFGLSCLIIAYLAFTSGFVPQLVALVSAVAATAWLTFLWRPLSTALYPYNLAVGVIGQAALCLWLAVFGATMNMSGAKAPS